MKNKVILVGHGGSGKDHLVKYLNDKGFMKNIGYTTRPIRSGETDGKDYYYISNESFQQKINDNFWHEYNIFVPEKEWYYGSSIEQFKEKNLFIKEPIGILKLTTTQRAQSMIIFININEGTRRERMLSRGSDDSVTRRINGDRKDFKDYNDFDLEIINPYFKCDEVYEDIINYLKNS